MKYVLPTYVHMYQYPKYINVGIYHVLMKYYEAATRLRCDLNKPTFFTHWLEVYELAARYEIYQIA